MITYTKHGDYYLPDLELPNDGLGEEIHICIWGQRRLDYLKKHKRLLYTNLLTSGKLQTHLHGIDVSARERWEIIIEQMKAVHGVTEELKANDQMEWVGRMNNIRACADEIIRSELIYD